MDADASTGVLTAVERRLADHFGHRPQRAAVSFVGVEPIEVLRFEPIPGERAYVTLGMARRPMTGASESVLVADGPRAELILHLHDPPDVHAEVWRRLAVLAAAPAVEGVVYVDGLTIEIGEPLTAGSRCVGFVVTSSSLGGLDTDEGRVDILAVLPATSNELAWARVHGSEALRGRWREQGVDLLDLSRGPVTLV